MPKIIPIETKIKIKEALKKKGRWRRSQSQIARDFKVSRLFVHCLHHNKPIPRTRPKNDIFNDRMFI